MTVRCFKGKQGPCLDRRQAVIYNGPWKAVFDDDGHELRRGERTAVCDKTFTIYTRPPYASHITPVPPNVPVPLEQAPQFQCLGAPLRSPRETKGDTTAVTRLPDSPCCGPGECC
jgi:hypothetical protein